MSKVMNFAISKFYNISKKIVVYAISLMNSTLFFKMIKTAN